MRTKEREPLLTDVEVRGSCVDDIDMDPIYVRNTYEAARAKDAELIQMAVNLTHRRVYEWTDEEFRAVLCNNELAFLSAAKEAGFTPSEP